jgi:hypothetical protein
MKIIAKLDCEWGGCPLAADPEDGSGDLLFIGKNVEKDFPELRESCAWDETLVRVPKEIAERFKAYLDEGK